MLVGSVLILKDLDGWLRLVQPATRPPAFRDAYDNLDEVLSRYYEANLPIVTDIPVATDVPIATDIPIVADMQTAVGVPIAVDIPITTDVPIGTDVPIEADGRSTEQ